MRLGVIFGRRQDPKSNETALLNFATAEARYASTNDAEGLGEVAFQRGVVYMTRRETAKAREELNRAIANAAAIGNKYLEIKARLPKRRTCLCLRYVEMTSAESHLRIVQSNLGQQFQVGLVCGLDQSSRFRERFFGLFVSAEPPKHSAAICECVRNTRFQTDALSELEIVIEGRERSGIIFLRQQRNTLAFSSTRYLVGIVVFGRQFQLTIEGDAGRAVFALLKLCLTQ